MSALVDGAEALGIHLSAGQLAQFDRYQAALLEANQRVNLTSISDPAQVETRHFLDSLTAGLPLLERLRAGDPVAAVDVGSGAGFPGLPLKIAFPRLRLALVESVGKKAAFLRQVVAMLQVEEVEIVQERAETATLPGSQHRDAYDAAFARALGKLPVVVEWCAPFLAPGGLLVAQRRGDLEAQTAAAAPAFSALKLWARLPTLITLPALNDGRGLVVGEKYAPTPGAFPRKAGLARKDPLGKR